MNPDDRIDWKEFLARKDLVWEVLPEAYNEAPFLGNGQLGSIVYFDREADAVKIEVYRSDVHDHRDSSDGWTAYSRPRFVIGYFHMHTRGDIRAGTMRLDLWNAELAGHVETVTGAISFKHIVHANEDLLLFTLEVEGDEEVRWSWHPGKAKTTRPGVPNTPADIEDFAKRYGDHYRETLQLYIPNPPAELRSLNDIEVCTQDLLAGGQYCTAWKSFSDDTAFAIAICNSYPACDAEDRAISLLKSTSESTISDLESSHRTWWNGYYPQSFLSVPDARLEAFYWIQMYKLACATRADRPMMDTSGPWFQPTPWPYITTDLNLQLCYWPVCASNRLDLGTSLINGLSRCTDALIKNVRPVEWQEDSAFMHITCAQDLVGPRNDDMRYWDCVGNLPWTLHNVWMMWRYGMNDQVLEDVLLPLLERSVNLYRHICDKDENGVLHLAPTYSPEYPVNPNRDCNYDLSLFKWGCKTLIDACERLNIDHPNIPVWHYIIDRLVDYPIDEAGVRIGADQSFDAGHRHFSHLLMIYPLYDLNVDAAGVPDLVRKSLQTWFDAGALSGYSYTSASSMSSAIGDGNAALSYLKALDPRIETNTLYIEAGPCMETPLAAAQSIHDMLIQSWGGVIRAFPAVADDWQNAVFHNLRAEGAFLVSARRAEGRTVWVRVVSEAGEPCRIKVDIRNPECWIDGHKTEPVQSAPGVFEPALEKGSSILVKESGSTVSAEISPLAMRPETHNIFGVKRTS